MFDLIFGLFGDAWFYLWTSFVLTIIVWLIFINAMLLREKEQELKKNKFVYYPLAVLFIIGYLLDILLNYYVGSTVNYLFDRLSKRGHKNSVFLPVVDYKNLTWKNTYKLTFTARLKHIKTTRIKDSLTYKMADFICYNMLRLFDKDHCSIGEVLQVMRTVQHDV